MTGVVQFLTPEGRGRLAAELEFLQTVKRSEVAANLKSARDDADLNENAGYQELKREQAFVEGRIRELASILANAQVLKAKGARDLVSLGARVTVAEEGRDSETYQIVGWAEADPLAGRISYESPVGAALLGRRVGDRVTVDAPGGVFHFEIIAIR
ncbi:MAG TPA: transcription elongation factor GreA [Anaerolineae bacterium]|nr:transcription elongation factor GreA [Anaerolineae bacterium]